MEQKDYKKLLRKIQLSANMFIDRNLFAGWVYSMIATELDENAHWNFIETDMLSEFNKEIELELRRRRGDKIEDNKNEQPSSQLISKQLPTKIYPPSPAVMKKVSKKAKQVIKSLETYPPDDGQLSDKQIRQIRKIANKQLAEKGIVVPPVSQDLEALSAAFKTRIKKLSKKKKTAKKKTKKTKK